MANITANDGNNTRSAGSVDGLHVFLAALNIFLSITASLSNAVILIALHKVTSIYPPTKLLFRCLAVTDLCVGLISQPLLAITILEIISDSVSPIFNASTIVLAAVSILTSTAISVDRLLALMMGLRYRHVVTLRRVQTLIICIWILSCALAAGIQFWVDNFNPIAFSVFIILIILCILTSLISYTKIYLRLRNRQIQLQENLQQQGQPPNGGGGGGEIPLNIARYKKTVSSIAWVQLALLVCYLPFSVSQILSFYHVLDLGSISGVILAFLFLNSSLNPVLYCWKIKDVRQAVKDTIKFNCCASS